jgi:hypothetical protein
MLYFWIPYNESIKMNAQYQSLNKKIIGIMVGTHNIEKH